MANKTGSTPRRRRTPEQARTEILDAAEELIAADGPDAVTLRAVADAAGISHGLITHYFGSWAAVVDAVLHRAHERRRAQIRDSIAAADGVPYADQLVAILFSTVSDRSYLRLWAWSILQGSDPDASSAGLTTMVDLLTDSFREVFRAHGEDREPNRARVERLVLLAQSAAYGYGLGRARWLTGLGHSPDDPQHDAGFTDALAEALAGYTERIDQP